MLCGPLGLGEEPKTLLTGPEPVIPSFLIYSQLGICDLDQFCTSSSLLGDTHWSKTLHQRVPVGPLCLLGSSWGGKNGLQWES